MIHFNALPTEDGFMVRAVEMLDTLWMLFAELLSHTFLILVIEIEIACG